MTDHNPSLTKIQEMIAEALSAALSSNGPKSKATKGNGKAPQVSKDGIDAAVIRAFKKAGYNSVAPRQDVQTYNRWLAQGYKVKTGEKSIKVKQFRLFHRKQVEPFSPSEKVVDLKPKAKKKAKTETTTLEPTLGL